MLMKIYGNFLLATLNARASWTSDLQHINGSLLFENALPPSKPLNFVRVEPALPSFVKPVPASLPTHFKSEVQDDDDLPSGASSPRSIQSSSSRSSSGSAAMTEQYCSDITLAV
ncbi:hypothetical protein BDN70DRAFT_662203 [Pholiota conissans]|uniref:Uncharacterized protein n=1 Tax=Pholiota conissans TaxID=109636 RepID=A0A9P6CUR7_9AGAR|nr:hypothetical protein BDN70DRAFT_662203 [Pholiota conissans]